MGITVKKPTRTFDIVTDLQLLRESLEKTQKYADKTKHTVTEKADLKNLLHKVDESTITLTLHGLNSSKWNMIVIQNSTVKGDSMVKDWPKMVADAIPQMLESAVWKTSGDAIEFADGDLAELLDSLTDVQTMDLIVAVQDLNTPTATVPKAVRDLI
ncbi:hypothetical protein [Bifidobacterium mongoliense]|uniref:Uncharacterized protein n=1 Tax=Bifidobacterium mongoliense TaxID=518643 RepID=A0A423UE11_9BIFI|nr:hypothetical protein [Bifidobacterium mongoliense]ROT86937.1 hypothetical protein BMONG18_0936 [Bifidobacterium mongoliense]